MLFRRLILPVLIISLLPAAILAQTARYVRIVRQSPEDLTGQVVTMIDGQERVIADEAWNAWIIEEGRAVVYSGSDGAGGFENEGQSLWRYDAATGGKRKLMAEFFMIRKVVEAQSRSGETALLVTMMDGGLGAPHVAVVDPKRGQVWRQQMARFVGVRNGNIAVALYDPDEIQLQENPRPRKLVYYSLDDLLSRNACPCWPVGVPLEVFE